MTKLTQEEADQLMALKKALESMEPIHFPKAGEFIYLNAHSLDGRIKFIIDVNRKGTIEIRCTYQTRYNKKIPLIRIDLVGREHENPDGEKIPCPHIHIYREGFGTRWAYPLSSKIITDTTDLVAVLSDFLEYNNIEERPPIVYQGDELI